MTSASTLGSSGSDHSYIVSTPSLIFTVTPPPTSRSSTGFVYVEYDNYDEYSSYEDLSIPSDTPDIIPTTSTSTTTASTTSTTARNPTTTASNERNTATRTMSPAPVPIVPTKGQRSTVVPVRLSAVPEFPTSVSADPDDIITTTLLPKETSQGRSHQINLTETEIESTSTSTSFFSLSKQENNSVDEVSYRIVGLDGEITRGQHNYFVPRMPPVRERTQNKRIQQLLNEKRRQDLLRRSGRSREGRTDRRHDGL